MEFLSYHLNYINIEKIKMGNFYSMIMSRNCNLFTQHTKNKKYQDYPGMIGSL